MIENFVLDRLIFADTSRTVSFVLDLLVIFIDSRFLVGVILLLTCSFFRRLLKVTLPSELAAQRALRSPFKSPIKSPFKNLSNSYSNAAGSDQDSPVKKMARYGLNNSQYLKSTFVMLMDHK